MSNLSNNTTELLNILNSLQGKAAGSGGGNGGIIEVLQLPTENIDNRYLYRVTVAALYVDGNKQGTTYVVAKLPEVGEPVTTDGATVTATYYNDTDNTLYGYVPDMIGAVLGVPAGWYDAATLLGALGLSYGGVVANSSDMTDKYSFYLLLSNPLYSYEDGHWYEVATSGANLTLKSRIFRSWNEAIAFCGRHNVYQIHALRLAFKYAGSTESTNTDNFITQYVSSYDGIIMARFALDYSFASAYYDVTFSVSYAEDGSATVDCFGYEKNFGGIGVEHRLIGAVDSSNVTQVTVYYFA